MFIFELYVFAIFRIITWKTLVMIMLEFCVDCFNVEAFNYHVWYVYVIVNIQMEVSNRDIW